VTLLLHSASGRSVNSVTPLLLFAVMFGLSMDYMVIMFARMREEYLNGRPHREAVLDGLPHTAAMVNGGAVIMIAVFASFSTAQIAIVQEIGIGLAVAVFLDAVLIRLVIMPSTLLLIGPRVWGRRAISVKPPNSAGQEPSSHGRAHPIQQPAGSTAP
jgi:RND superfamily putative drug exporter